jgi:hypothetical protein
MRQHEVDPPATASTRHEPIADQKVGPMAGANVEPVVSNTPDFLAYLRSSPVTNELANELAFVVDRRHTVARLEQRRAS